jgi:hypothetical protein
MNPPLGRRKTPGERAATTEILDGEAGIYGCTTAHRVWLGQAGEAWSNPAIVEPSHGQTQPFGQCFVLTDFSHSHAGLFRMMLPHPGVL